MPATGSPDVSLSAGLDQGTEEAIARLIEKALGDGADRGAAAMDRALNAGKGKAAVNKLAKDLNEALSKSSLKGIASMGKELQSTLNNASKEAYNLTRALQLAGNEAKVIAANQYRARSIDRAAAITQREIISREAQQKLEVQRGANSRLAIEAQRAAQTQIIATRTAGKQRVALTQATLQTIGRLEKGLGVTIAGVARTMTSGISKAFSSITPLLRRNNNAFTEGLTPALRSRETIINNSFSRQERELRSSVLRQERQLTELRTITSKGVLGAVSGRGVGLGIAGIAGGIGIASLVSTGYQDAVNFGEQVNKNKVVFGEFIDAILAFTSQAPTALGATQAAALEATGTFGNLFRSLGLAGGQSAMLSVSLTQIATDLSSFNNVPVEDAFLALRSGLVGESEPLRKFGIDVSDARLRHEAFLLGISDGKSVLTAAQKAQAAYSAIVKDSALAQGDFARTANEGANAARVRQASILQLVSSLERKFLPVITAANIALGKTAAGLTAFVEGKVGPGLLIVRDALKGMAAGMLAVVAAKGAIEVVKLLAVTSKLLLTPMGAVLVAAGLLGAAISVLSTRSKPLHDAFVKLADKAGAVAAKVRDFFTPAVKAAMSFVTDTAIPAVISFADYVGTHLMSALTAAADFITKTVVPAVQNFAGTVRDDLTKAWAFVSEKADAFFQKVLPFLRPAIEGFKVLATAIGTAFGGDFSGLRNGAANALSGIGATVASIASAVGKALLPVGKQVLDFFAGVFSPPNLKKMAMAVLGFVEEVGRIIGSIVSDPLFIKAVLGIAAAAVIIGAKFIQGFAEGVITNLPKLVSMIGDGLLAGLGAVLSNPEIILAAIAIGPLAARLFQRFRGVGESAGSGLSVGLRTKLADAGGFLSGLFGGSGSAAAKAKVSLKKELDGINREITALGGKKLGFGFNLNDQSIVKARDALTKLKSGFTDAEIAGRMFRQKIEQHFTAVGGIFSGLGKALGGVAKLITAPFKAVIDSGALNQFGGLGSKGFIASLSEGLRSGSSAIAQGLSGAWQSLKTLAKEQGTSVGRIVGSAIGSAAAVGLSAFVGGKAEGASGGNGLFGALTAGVTGFALTGNPIIGAAAAGVSLLGTAIGHAGYEAKKFKEQVKQVAGALKDDLKKAAEDGTISIDKLTTGMVGLGDVAGLSAFRSAVQDALGADGIKALDQFGLTWSRDIAPIFAAGGDLDTMKKKLADTFFTAAASSDEFSRRFGADAEKVAAVLSQINEKGGPTTINDWLTAINGSDEVSARFANTIINNADYLQNVLDTSGDLTKAANATKKALDEINSSSRVFADFKPGTIVGSLDTVEKHVRAINDITLVANDQLDSLFNQGVTPAALAQAKAISAAANLGQSLQSTATNGGLNQVTAANFTINKAELSKTIGDALRDAPAGTIVDDASARAYVQPIIDAYLSGITDPALAAQIKADLEKSLPALYPTFDNKKTADASAAEAQKISDYMTENFPAVDITKFNFNTAKALTDLGLTVDDVKQYVADHPALAGVTFDEQAAALVGSKMAGATQEGYAASQHPLPMPTPTVDLTAAHNKGAGLGAAIANGTKDGIDAKIAVVVAKAVKMVNDSIDAAKFAARVRSPSRKFYEIGQFIGQGLANGIADTTQDVTSVVSKVVEDAIKAATEKAGGISTAMSTASAALFGALVGSGAGLNTTAPLTNAQAGITNAVQSLLSTVGSNAQTVWDVNAKKAKDLTAADKNILGESAFSLNVNDVIGASNLQALTGAFDAIATLGQTLLAQGQDANTVAATLQRQVEDLIRTAVNLGFSQADVLALADSLGLSSDALAAFIQQLNDVQNAVPAATNPNRLPDVGLMTPGVPISKHGQTRHVEVNVYPQTTDPSAIALGVANRLARIV